MVFTTGFGFFPSLFGLQFVSLFIFLFIFIFSIIFLFITYFLQLIIQNIFLQQTFVPPPQSHPNNDRGKFISFKILYIYIFISLYIYEFIHPYYYYYFDRRTYTRTNSTKWSITNVNHTWYISFIISFILLILSRTKNYQYFWYSV